MYTKEVATIEIKVEGLQKEPFSLKFHHKNMLLMKPLGWKVTNFILASDPPYPLCHHLHNV